MIAFVTKDDRLHLECFEGRVVIRARALLFVAVAAFLGSIAASYVPVIL